MKKKKKTYVNVNHITDKNELILTYTIEQKMVNRTVVGVNQIPMLRHTLQEKKTGP